MLTELSSQKIKTGKKLIWLYNFWHLENKELRHRPLLLLAIPTSILDKSSAHKKTYAGKRQQHCNLEWGNQSTTTITVVCSQTLRFDRALHLKHKPNPFRATKMVLASCLTLHYSKCNTVNDFQCTYTQPTTDRIQSSFNVSLVAHCEHLLTAWCISMFATMRRMR